ncbi:mechanosensitive ion channel family protein [Thalassomonas haliotis]|uniref:Mechanosensitive ion channel family protein n=1 Tax=Thalassomonas haliotis TaxID=485448 RepID=A0ABY7VDJ6_9GAMM|nr:mechanosensitive ion channel family protein [Thalassomonas haliotis]WDE11732.1 mechanosensitive ion channel family protein [Thalassomonas haliotis]
MHQVLTMWLADNGVSPAYLEISALLAGTGLILLISAIAYYLARHQVLVLVHKLVIGTRNDWDDLLIEHQVFSRTALLVPFLLLLFLTPVFLSPEDFYSHFLQVMAKCAISLQVAFCISALLNVIKALYLRSSRERYLPFNATIQVLKLIVYLVAVILAISFILERSPLYLLSGLGALTAVLLLIFQDTIKGLVASIQISANRMVAPGDWIEVPQFGADGDVLEIGLITVKVKNFDKTITTIPTYALTSGSFKNWRDMYQSGGRRIKRAIRIDISSIDFCSRQQIDGFNDIVLLKEYLAEKRQQLLLSNQAAGIAQEDKINSRQLTNIGTFRAYIEAYLKQHPQVHPQMTCMVRQLPAEGTGLPLELYFFSKEQAWVSYEGIQADIFDHLYAMAPYFGLRIFQHPGGFDWQQDKPAFPGGK